MLIGLFPPFRVAQPVTTGVQQPNFIPAASLQAPGLPGLKEAAYGQDCLALSAKLATRQKQVQRLARLKQQAAAHFAEQFCKATIDVFGTDEKALKSILKDVHRLGIRPEFKLAVLSATQLRGKPFQRVSDIIEREFAANPLEKWFKNAPRKESMDYWRTGQNQYRATAWDYRLNGMYRSMADFGLLCQKHPVMSTAVIGSVATLGHLYPFMGAVSGLAILAWAGAFSLMHETLALKHPQMNDQKAGHYKTSGQNLAAVLLTTLGAKGISQGSKNGMKAYQNTTDDAIRSGEYNSFSTPLAGIWNATKARSTGEHKTNAFESVLFVTGLFDNVLLPFNWAADHFKHKPSENK